MPDISFPEIHLPDIKLPDGLRDMNRRDIQNAINDRMPGKIEMPDVDLSKLELPKAIDDRLTRVEKRLARIDLPKAIEDRMPGRKRSNPILPIAAILAIGSMIAAAWWLISTPGATLRVRETADRLRMKMSGQSTGVVRYDDEADLGSLLPDPDESAAAVEVEPWPDTFAEIGDSMKAGNGHSVEEHPAGV